MIPTPPPRRLFGLAAGLILPLLALPAPAHACGLSTHGELANRGLHWFNSDGLTRDYDPILAAHPEAFQAGAPFPDWGYACGYGDAAEDAHWPPFLREAAGYVNETYPGAWDADTERLVAFLFGVTAHSISDISWHGLGVSEGFLDAMAGQDFYGDFGDAHTHGDTGGDMIAARELGNDWLVHRWYVPLDDIMAIYSRAGHEDIPPKLVERCVGLLYLGTFAESVAGTLLFPYFAVGSPFLTDEYLDYFVGGVDDMAVWSAWSWRDMAQWIETGPSRSGETYWAQSRGAAPGRAAQHARHEAEPYSAAHLAERLGLRLKVERSARGVWLSVDPESIPPALAAAHRMAQGGGDAPEGAREARSATAERPLISPRAQTPGAATVTSAATFAYLGRALSAGDYDGDGRIDLAFGAHGLGTPALPQRGAVYIQWGIAGSDAPRVLPALEGDALPPGIDARFGQEEYLRLGFSLTTVDFNADGYDDLVAATPTLGARSLSYRGGVQIFLGGPGGLGQSPDVVIEGEGTYTGLGTVLSRGDVDGDGRADLLIGAPFARAGGRQVGEAFVFLAHEGRGAGQALTQSDADWRLQGASDWGWFGASMAVAEGPGGRRLLIGSPGTRVGDAQTAGRLDGFDPTGVGVGGASTDAVFTIFGGGEAEKLGHAIALGRPAPGEGLLIALARPGYTAGDQIHAGAVDLYPVEDWAGDIDLSSLTPLMSLEGDQYHSRLGWSLSLEDINGDGVSDLTIGEPLRRTPAGHEGGAVHALYGGASFLGREGGGRTLRAADDSWIGGEGAGRFGQSILPLPEGEGMLISAHRSAQDARNGGAVFETGR